MTTPPSPKAAESMAWADLLTAIANGKGLLTGNRRLAQQLQQAHERQMTASGREVWDTPVVAPWADWLRSLWQSARLAGQVPAQMLLAAEQERHLWERIVRTSPEGEALLRPAPAAAQAAEAYNLMHDWRLDPPDSLMALTDDTRAFAAWRTTFDTHCKERSWVAACRLPALLCAHPAALAGMTNRDWLLLGFEELTPAQLELLSAFTAVGGRWQWVQPSGDAGDCIHLAIDDRAKEIAVMADWVKSRLRARPDASIGIVVPDLTARRETICRALDDRLAPAIRQPGQGERPRPYNVTLGRPLADYPIVVTALRLLGLACGRRPFAEAAALLHTPYLAAWQDESGRRALLDRRLRVVGATEIGLSWLRREAARGDRPWHCPELAARLTAIEKLRHDWPRQARAGTWAQYFSQLLQTAGWAEGRTLSSHEYQTIEAWRETLTRLVTLETVGTTMKPGEALGLLGDLLAQRLFQPRSNPAPVQVMGLYESIGCHFDHLWIMGMDDEAWPAPPRPNSFLPLVLQHSHGLPRASESREFEVALRITERLCRSAAEVVFSHAIRDGEARRDASPLIATLPEKDLPDLGIADTERWSQLITASAAIECIEDQPPPPVTAGPVAGGSALFSLQAACPFRAFAELRLGARPLREVEIGIDAMTRGSLVHDVLQLFWDDVGDQATLLGLDDSERQIRIDAAIGLAIDKATRQRPHVFTPAMRQIEQQRLGRLVGEWLELECQRPAFAIAATEETIEAGFAGLTVNLRIDRIDRLPDGRHIVIDYKTGTVKPAAWFGERPDDPQLPLYAAVKGENLAGLVFARLRPGETGFCGIVVEDGLVPGADTPKTLTRHDDGEDWDELLANWSTTIAALAHDFREGAAAIDPKHPPETCRYCELAGLCRIDEADETLALIEPENEDD